MNKTLLVFTILFAGIVCGLSAQSVEKLRPVSGRVMDAENGEPLAGGSVMIMAPDTTSMFAGSSTGTNGRFIIKDVKPGQYLIKISYIGYHNFYRPLHVADSTNSVAVGTVLLTPSSVMLETAVVKGQSAQVEVKEDTLIFNAAAFKVPEGSVLEELIRKMPGAEVADDGTIKINGKTVKKILVEGKEFFSGQKNMAMKNIPTEIVDKVKAYDKQSDLARITGIDDGEEETVLDLSIKKRHETRMVW